MKTTPSELVMHLIQIKLDEELTPYPLVDEGEHKERTRDEDGYLRVRR
jgi:hypothetical protein